MFQHEVESHGLIGAMVPAPLTNGPRRQQPAGRRRAESFETVRVRSWTWWTLGREAQASELPADLRQRLDSQNLGRLPTLTKDGALKFLNERGMPVRRNAVVTAFNSKELVSGIYSGKRLASEYDVTTWAISRLEDRDGTAVCA